MKHHYIIVYAEAAHFGELWKKYLEYVPQVNYQYKRMDSGIPTNEVSTMSGICLARTRHDCDGRETMLYHHLLFRQTCSILLDGPIVNTYMFCLRLYYPLSLPQVQGELNFLNFVLPGSWKCFQILRTHNLLLFYLIF